MMILHLFNKLFGINWSINLMNKKKISKFILIFVMAVTVILFFTAYTNYLSVPDVKEEAKTINILTYKNIPLSALDGFHSKYPSYKVNIERYSELNYLSFLDTKLKQEASIDIIELPAEEYAGYIRQDMLQPITSPSLFARFNSSALDYLTELSGSEEYYGIPYHSDYLGVWYNVSLFNKYSLAPPNNRENFLKACEVFSKNKILPVSIGLADDTAANNLMTLLTADTFRFVPSPIGYNNDFARIDNPDSLLALQSCYDMLQKGYLSSACLSMTDAQAFQAFLNSSYAMAISSEHSISMITDSVLAQIDLNVCGFYTSSDSQKSLVIGAPVDSVLCISKQSSNIPACELFFDYYTQYDTVFRYINDTRIMTTIQNYSITPELSKSWENIKKQPCYVPAEHFYLSPFLCDADTYSLPRRLFYNLITPQEFITILRKGEHYE